MARKLTPFRVCSGTEEFDLDREVEQARASKSRRVICLDGRDLTGDDILSACESDSIMDDRLLLVVVDHAEQVKDIKVLEEYIEAKSPEDLSSILVAIIRPPSKGEPKIPKVWTLAAAKGVSKEYKKWKPWETQIKLTRLDREAGILGMTLGKGVGELLLGAVGDDLYVLSNELRKLALLVGQHGTVTPAHVQRVVAFQPPATPFEVADAACEKNVKKAMNLVAHLYRHEGDAANVPITSALIRQVEHLLVVRSMVEAHKSKEEITTRMSGEPYKISPYRLQNTYLLWSNRHTTTSLMNNLAHLCRLDANVKGPARSKRTLVELAVLSIAS